MVNIKLLKMGHTLEESNLHRRDSAFLNLLDRCSTVELRGDKGQAGTPVIACI